MPWAPKPSNSDGLGAQLAVSLARAALRTERLKHPTLAQEREQAVDGERRVLRAEDHVR
jgi:hypothetical protein